MEQENKFQSLINFLVNWNNIAKFDELTWEVIGERLYIDGIPRTLANLYALLWSATEDYHFYFCNRDNCSMIEVLKIER